MQVRFAERNLILNVFLPKGIARLQAKNCKLIDIIYKMLGQTSINQTSSYSVFCFINLVLDANHELDISFLLKVQKIVNGRFQLIVASPNMLSILFLLLS